MSINLENIDKALPGTINILEILAAGSKKNSRYHVELEELYNMLPDITRSSMSLEDLHSTVSDLYDMNLLSGTPAFPGRRILRIGITIAGKNAIYHFVDTNVQAQPLYNIYHSKNVNIGDKSSIINYEVSSTSVTEEVNNILREITISHSNSLTSENLKDITNAAETTDIKMKAGFIEKCIDEVPGGLVRAGLSTALSMLVQLL